MLTVLKFGGSTFPTLDGYGALARELDKRIAEQRSPLAVVVSAMPGETELLRSRLYDVNRHPADASVAGLLTLADTVSAHLLVAALHSQGRRATVMVGHQLGFRTSNSFMWAQLEDIDGAPLRAALADNDVVVVPGGQAVDELRRPTWLGKNSSDLSAVATAVAIGASRCEIFSDVDGVYSADPNLVKGARRIPRLSYEVAGSMSLHGAKVLHRGAVRLAQEHGIEIVCRLNRAPFTAGTVIDGAGGPAKAVIVNPKSLLVAYDGSEEADRAHHAFTGAGIETVRVDHDRGPLVMVVGGYVDLDTFMKRSGVGGIPIPGIPVTEIHENDVTTHILPDRDAAVRFAQQCHDKIYDAAALSERRSGLHGATHYDSLGR